MFRDAAVAAQVDPLLDIMVREAEMEAAQRAADRELEELEFIEWMNAID